ncbi:ribose transport system permease protein [Cellulosimicrobium cellulans]|uniref:ABC transporter permease n=1 Tax=Cellulosimicrobium cellulans TaxID=1710 RepID=UPI001959643C|nr:ABC transporter permease [Cellulosimicrobium cellulans]MBM7817769.1 ribose transport system permease protein [Cellulosimicrobium cellulans]
MSRRRVPDEVGIAGILVLVVVVMSLLSPNFRTAGNFEVLLLNGAVVALLALGQTFVLLTGGIDLSTGSNLALTGMAAALGMQAGLPWWAATVLALVVGVAVGLVNGIFVHYLRLPPFIATFSMFGIAGSIPMILTGAASVTVRDPMFAFLGRGGVFGIPTPILIVALVAVVFSVLLARTSTGVHIYALGGNKETARLAGIHTGRTTLFVYAVSGLCAALAGVVTTSRLMVGYPSAGSGNELFYSIAAAVVGGVSLFGGVGSIGGALLGAVLIATVSNGMNVVGVDSFWQPLVIGVIILAGVSLDTYRRSLSTTGGKGRLFLQLLQPRRASRATS